MISDSAVKASQPSRNVEAIYPLSPLQEGLLYHTLSAPSSGIYFIQTDHTFRGNLDVPSFRLAWENVVARHSSLRTLFAWKGRDKPLQIVRYQVQLPWKEFDWRQVAPDQQKKQLEEYLEADRILGFELSKAPLMRLLLVRTGEETYHFVWSFHHLVLDGWSHALVFREVLALYDAFSEGRDLSLDAVRPYRDYIVWLQKQDLSKAESFWREALKGFASPTSFGVDAGYSATIADGNGHRRRSRELSCETTIALQSVARQNHITLNTIIQGAWAILLSRYCGEEDVAFGVASAGRPAEMTGSDRMVGLFINTLPMRVNVSGESSMRSWLQELQIGQVEARQYEFTPLTSIQKWSDLPPGSPIFESFVAFENYPRRPMEKSLFGGIEIIDNRFSEHNNFPLSLLVLPEINLSLLLEYDSSRFNDSTVDRILGHLRALLESIVANPDQKVGDLPVLTEAEHHEVLEIWNATDAEYPRDKCIHQLFEEQVVRTPDRVAVIFGNQRCMYRDLNQRANQLANYLRKQGVGPDVPVGICMERSIDMIVSVLGILKAGGAYLPLDPRYPPSRLATIMDDAQVPLILTQIHLSYQLPSNNARVVRIDSEWGDIEAENRENPAVLNKVQDLAYILYTSGSTGRPKGVTIEHRNTVAFISWARETFTSAELCGVLFSTSLCFDLSVFELFVPLTGGGTVIGAENALELNRLAAKDEVTLINTVPSAIAELVCEGGWPASIRTVNLAGEPLTNRLAQSIYAQGSIKHVYNLYGPTEDTTYSTWVRIQPHASEEPTIGRPISNGQAYILDKHLRLLPVGIMGELYLGGAGLARGYWKRPELTAERFIRNPIRPETRLYRTGDLARYKPDGNIEYLGRIDHQVKLRGFRIELGEIEVVLEKYPPVRKCVVIVREDAGDSKRLVAYCVPNAHAAPVIGELRNYLKERLPDYMVPSVFVILQALPLTPNGKIDRRALPEPDANVSDGRTDLIVARTPVEQSLAAIWSKILRLDRVGVRDDFFELGGNSLDYFAMFNRIEQEFGKSLTMAALRQAPTIERLAEVLSQPDGDPITLSSPAMRNDSGRFLSKLRRWWASPRRYKEIYEITFKRVFQIGPVLGRFVLPYTLGDRFIRWFLHRRLARLLFFRKWLRLVQRHVPPQTADPAAACNLCLYSNVWVVWRAAALARCGPVDFKQRIHVVDFSFFEDACDEGHGIVLVSSHAHMRRILPWILHLAGYDDWGAFGIGSDDGTLRAMGVRNAVLTTVDDYSERSYFANKLYYAKQILDRGGIVQVAPDGPMGIDAAITVPFFGRSLTLRTGFAELALSTGAPIIPVSTALDAMGNVTVQFLPRLEVPDSNHRKQVESLALQYVEIYHREWTENYGNVNWRYIWRFSNNLPPFDNPGIDRSTGSTSVSDLQPFARSE